LERLQERRGARRKPEETVEVDRGLASAARLRHGERGPRGVEIAIAVRDARREPVHPSTQEDVHEHVLSAAASARERETRQPERRAQREQRRLLGAAEECAARGGIGRHGSLRREGSSIGSQYSWKLGDDAASAMASRTIDSSKWCAFATNSRSRA